MTKSVASVDEDGSVLFTLATTGVAVGSDYTYTLSGVSASDVVGGSLTGTARIGSDGKAVIQVNLAEDARTEGTETLTLSVAGQSTSVSVVDTSTAPGAVVATYNVSADAASVNEGGTATFRVETTNVASGSQIAYSLSGVSSSDVVGGQLTGLATVGVDGVALVSVNLAADATTEGVETLTLNIANQTASVSVADTSAAAAEQTSFTVTPGEIATANVGAGTAIALNVGNTGSRTVTIQSDGASPTAGVIINGDANTTVTSGASGDRITLTGEGNNSITSGAGNDTVTVFGSGNNSVNVGAGTDAVTTGAGNDTITFGSGALGAGDTVDAGEGVDTVIISGEGNVIGTGGATLVGVENLVLNGTSVSIDATVLQSLIEGGLTSISGSPLTSELTITGLNNLPGPDILDLSTLQIIGGLESIKTTGTGTLILSTEQAAQVELVAADSGTLTQQTIIPGAQTVADATALLAGGSTAQYALVDTAANLATAPKAVYGNAISVEASTVASAAQAAEIQSLITAGSFTGDINYSVSDTADMLSSFTGGLGNATTVTSTTVANEAQATAIYDASALGTVTTAVVYAVADTATTLAGSANDDALNAATSVTITDTATIVEVNTINSGLAGEAGGLTKVASGYTLTGVVADADNDGAGADDATDPDLTDSAAVTTAAGNITVVSAGNDAVAGPISVANALAVEALSNTGTNSYALSDAINTLLGANANVRGSASAVAYSGGGTLTVSQANQLALLYTNDQLDAATIAISDTVANLLTLSSAAVAAADTISITGDAGTVDQIVDLTELAGAALGAYDVADSASSLATAVADDATLAILNAATSVSITGDATVAQVAEINEALTGSVEAEYTLADSAAALADVDAQSIVDGALVVKVGGTATIAEIDAIADAYTSTGVDATLGTQLVYTLADTAANVLRGSVSGGATHTLANYQAGATSISITDDAVTVGDADDLLALLNFDGTYSINDEVAALVAADADTLDGAGTVTVTDNATALIGANGITVRADASVDNVVVVDDLDDLDDQTKFTAALKADTTTIIITDSDLNVGDAEAVNALAALKPTTYSIIDGYADLTTYADAAERTAVETLIAGASVVTVDAASDGADTITVANYNTLDALTAGNVVANIEDTFAKLAAADAAAAISAVLANTDDVTISAASIAAGPATLEQVNTLIARGVPLVNGSALAVADTAAALNGMTGATFTVLETDGSTITVSDNGQLTQLTVAGAEAIYDLGAAADGSSYGNYDLEAQAIDLAGLVVSNPALFQGANAVVARTDATVAEAIALTSVETLGQVSFNVNDTAAHLADTSNAPRADALNKAGDITASDVATVDEAEVIAAITNSGEKTFSISDVAANFASTGGTAFASATVRSSTLNAAVNVAITDTTDVATAKIALDASSTGTTTISAVTDTAAKVATLALGSTDNIATITANTGAKVTEAAVLVALDDADTTVAYNLADTAAELAGAGTAVLNGAGTITATTAATAAEAALISAATAAPTDTVFDVEDTAERLAALSTDVLNDSREIIATTAATIAQAAKLSAASPLDGVTSFDIVDSFANIMAAAVIGTVTNASAIADAGTVTVTDASLTVAQAVALRAVSGTPTYVYSIKDNDAAIVNAAGGADAAALSGATSVTGSQGTALSFASVGASPTFGITGTKAQLDALSSELATLTRIYQVSVADLEANPSFYGTLSGTQLLSVQDNAANLLSGNALLASARQIAVDGEVTATQATQITALSSVDTTSYIVRDTASALSGINEPALDNASKIIATTDATVAEAANIAGATATAANTSYSVNGTISAIATAAAAASVTGATNITATGTTNTLADVTALLGVANTGQTVIAEATLTASQAAGLTFNATGDDKITALTVSGTASVEQATEILGDLTAGDLGSVTYSISDTAEALADASAAVLNGATAITATDDVSLALAATLDAASATNANTVYELADTAENILSASAALLARGDDDVSGQGNVIHVTGTVTASQAAQLIALDAANNTVGADESGAFQIAGATTVGEFAFEDSYASLMPAGVAATGLADATSVKVTNSSITAAQAAALDTASGTATLTLNISDTYSQLFSATSTTRDLATTIDITNAVSASQASTAKGWNSGAVTYNVSSTAAAVAAVLVSNAAAITSSSAKAVTLTNAATVAQAAYLSEVSKITYSINDTAAHIQAALDTANAANVADRETLLGATSIVVSDFASIDEALGVAANEERGLYTLGSKVIYSIEDSGTNIAAALNGVDAAGVSNASVVKLGDTEAEYTMSLADAEVVTALENYAGADHDTNAATAGVYALADTAAKIESGDATLVAGALKVTAQGSSSSDTIDFSAFGRGVTLEGLANADNLFGSEFADVLIGGAAADVLTGGSGADTFSFGATDTASAVFADAGASAAAIDNGDTFTGAFDVITDIAAGDIIDLVGTLTQAAANGVTGAATAGKYDAIRGDYAGTVFTVSSSGTATLVVFHDGSTGLDAIVLQGVTSTAGITIG